MKKTIILLVSFLFFSVLCSYSLVYGKWIVGSGDSIPDIVSKNIFLDSSKLNDVILSYDTSKNLSSFELKSNCNISAKFLGKTSENNYFKVKILDNLCNKQQFFLQRGEEILFDKRFKLKIFSDGDIFGVFSDLNENNLNKILRKIENDIIKYSKYENFDKDADLTVFEFIKRKRFYKELLYKKEILERVINKRKNKYTTPVAGYNISEKSSKIPNALRSYRSKYTDGIHHGRDVDAPLGSDIKTIDDGVVIRVVNDFSYTDLDKIKHKKDLTLEEQLKNLDLLRGNQVWIKTSKGDVVFYSHLDKIYSYIREGDLLPVNSPIGTIGVSGIPDKHYTDYHLHFSIHKNPYNTSKAGKYNIVDYMKWDWYFKGKDKKYVLDNQYNIFEKNKSLTYDEKHLK